MSFLLLHADAGSTLLTDDPVVPAAQLPALRDALSLLTSAGALRDRAQVAGDEAAADARQDGRTDGEAEGRAIAQAELGAELVRLGEQAAARDAERHADVVRLATGVVRRIAGDLGSELVAGLAERAAAALAGEQQAIVRVHPSTVDAVSRRLSGHSQLRVEGDPALAPTDCVIDSPLGRTMAGLELQLERIEQAWAESGRPATVGDGADRAAG